MNTSLVFLLLLCTALCRAGWSSIVKSRNPIPLVADLREISIIFSLLIGTLILKRKIYSFNNNYNIDYFFGVILLKFF